MSVSDATHTVSKSLTCEIKKILSRLIANSPITFFQSCGVLELQVRDLLTIRIASETLTSEFD